MFGMSFGEIFIILVIAIIFVGPEKLPKVAVDIARFFRKFKTAVNDAKVAIDDELRLNEIKEEAKKYKAQIEHSTAEIKTQLDEIVDVKDDINDISSDINDIFDEDDEYINKLKTKEAKKKEKKEKKQKSDKYA